MTSRLLTFYIAFFFTAFVVTSCVDKIAEQSTEVVTAQDGSSKEPAEVSLPTFTEVLIAEIDAAETMLDFAVGRWEDPEITEAFTRALSRGVRVRGVASDGHAKFLLGRSLKLVEQIPSAFLLRDQEAIVVTAKNWLAGSALYASADADVLKGLACVFELLWQKDVDMYLAESHLCRNDSVVSASKQGKPLEAYLVEEIRRTKHSIVVRADSLTSRDLEEELNTFAANGGALRIASADCSPSQLKGKVARVVANGVASIVFDETRFAMIASDLTTDALRTSVIIRGATAVVQAKNVAESDVQGTPCP
jgi:hypothetical protein